MSKKKVKSLPVRQEKYSDLGLVRKEKAKTNFSCSLSLKDKQKLAKASNNMNLLADSKVITLSDTIRAMIRYCDAKVDAKTLNSQLGFNL